MEFAATTSSKPLFNPHPRIERLEFARDRWCLVIDDVLSEPERLVDNASAQRAAFHDVDFNAYPGTYLIAPDALTRALDDFFRAHIRRCFDARRLLDTHCRFSLVTRPTSALRPCQSICHQDAHGIGAQLSAQASVLYLFHDEALGGTSFYEATRAFDETNELFRDSNRMSAAEFAARYGIAPGYMCASNDWFERVGGVAAKWNRMIVYDGTRLHSGDIAHPEKLSSDPARGRLTLNGFFTCRRHAA